MENFLFVELELTSIIGHRIWLVEKYSSRMWLQWKVLTVLHVSAHSSKGRGGAKERRSRKGLFSMRTRLELRKLRRKQKDGMQNHACLGLERLMGTELEPPSSNEKNPREIKRLDAPVKSRTDTNHAAWALALFLCLALSLSLSLSPSGYDFPSEWMRKWERWGPVASPLLLYALWGASDNKHDTTPNQMNICIGIGAGWHWATCFSPSDIKWLCICSLKQSRNQQLLILHYLVWQQ